MRQQRALGAAMRLVLSRIRFRLCGTCLTICTEDLYRCLLRVLVYLVRSDGLGVSFSKDAPGGAKLKAYVDSNWATSRSTPLSSVPECDDVV